MQKEDQNRLYTVVKGRIPASVMRRKNASKSWKLGYSAKYDVVVISRSGTVGEVYEINNLYIALPKAPTKVKKYNNRWEPAECPRQLTKIRTIFDWNKKERSFKDKWVEYIEKEFDTRDEGHWFTNNDVPTYITGTHYMYLQWTKIDIGKPEFRESNRIFYIFWEACKVDTRCFGM